jgi:hypothetical protein
MVEILKDLLTEEASGKVISQLKKGGGLKFFVNQELRVLA